MPRILIVEDDPGFRSILETLLRLEGHEVHLAADGARGLEQARSRKPDIVLTDLEMPGMSGLDLCKALKAEPSTAHAYIIMLTGQGGQGAKLDGLRAGVDDFLVKPSSGPEIHGRLEIAQKVMAVMSSEREARKKADTTAAALGAATGALDALVKSLDEAEAAILQKNAAALGTALKAAKEHAARAKAAATSAAPAASESSWL
jgi:DNA-binding response OmpR family regulator